MAPVASASPSDQAAAFPTAAFAGISLDPVSEGATAEFQAILTDVAGGGGMAAAMPDGESTAALKKRWRLLAIPRQCNRGPHNRGHGI